MQESCAGANLPRRVGVAEHLINFKSSPNFINMKKIIRWKMDRTSDFAPPPPPPDIPPEKKKIEVQPPLPPVPPPPDIPWKVSVKQEVEDHEYIGAYGQYSMPAETPYTDTEQVDVKPRVTVCRDYIRGACKRGRTCKFAHKFDVSQLTGVYTFCHEYQTKVCTRANCKFVHASVFEEQNFYRTGYLPPHVFNHKKTTNSQSQELTPMSSSSTSGALPPPPPPPPLPPPPPPPPEEPVPEFQFTKPPPPLPTSMERLFMPMRSLEESYLDLLMSNPLKRSWASMEASLLDHELCEYPKKCKHCDIMEFRLQHSRNKLQKMILSNEALGVKIAHIDKKNAKLESIIMKVLTSSTPPTPPVHYTPPAFSLPSYNRDMAQIEQLAAIWNF